MYICSFNVYVCTHLCMNNIISNIRKSNLSLYRDRKWDQFVFNNIISKSSKVPGSFTYLMLFDFSLNFCDKL